MTTYHDDDYKVNILGAIRSLLAGYSGGISIVREMIQNADDVPGEDERWVELHFNPDSLVIKNNTRFQRSDFDNIKSIASGAKAFVAHATTGTFGVGFVSVYQLTDTPILRSSGREVHFFPDRGKAPSYSSDVENYTEFELPYRRAETDIGKWLGMTAVGEDWVRDMIDNALPRELPRLLFFLRRVNRVSVYERGSHSFEVTRELTLATDDDKIERLFLTIIDQNGNSTSQTWLRLTGWVTTDPPQRVDGKPEKDGTIQLVLPDMDVPTTFWRQVGRLYNYLPTDIETKLPFHINGDFYPSTDRKSVDNDHHSHLEWNTHVLRALGGCLATALPSLLEHFATEPLQLYQRLPIKPAHPLVQPIIDACAAAARPLPVFYTQAGWNTWADTRWASDTIQAFVKHADQRLMEPELQTAAWELLQKLGVRQYTLIDLLNCLTTKIKPGQTLHDGPMFLQNRPQIDALYAILDHESTPSNDNQIKNTPIFLDHQDRLWPAYQCVRTSQPELHQSLGESGLRFWVGNAQHFRRIANLVPTFELSHLWTELRRQLQHDMPLVNAPPWLNSISKLYGLYNILRKTGLAINRNEVENVPLCLGRNQHLYRPKAVYMPLGEPVVYELLADDTGAQLVLQTIQEHKQYRALYEDMGVQPFQWTMLLARLEKLVKNSMPLTQSPYFGTRDKLLRLYRYLSKHRSEFEHKHALELQKLSIWLCRDGILRNAKDLYDVPQKSDRK